MLFWHDPEILYEERAYEDSRKKSNYRTGLSGSRCHPVDDTYYMVSTTMHFMPGCEILRSYDLIHWEHLSYVYERLDSTEEQRLVGEKNCYGKGMWAASLRYHKGMYYICFVANDTGKTYLYTADDIEGPWEKRIIEGFYHDCSLLFEDDHVYIVSGNRNVRLQELKKDLGGPKEGGLDRILVSDSRNPGLGFEGSHFYKINGMYYLFLIHSLPDRWMRTQACYVSDSLTGEFRGGDVLCDTMGYCGQGVAQGGIVDTPDHKWYAVLFQDRGAVGRIPVLVPVKWEKNVRVTYMPAPGEQKEQIIKENYPVLGDSGRALCEVETKSTRPEEQYHSLVESDDFQNGIRTRNGCLERLDGRAAGSSITNRNFPGLRMMQKRVPPNEL